LLVFWTRIAYTYNYQLGIMTPYVQLVCTSNKNLGEFGLF